ncbi:MAG: hypothetical protein ACRD4O_18485 [Bryobacteraceae bacterium]
MFELLEDRVRAERPRAWYAAFLTFAVLLIIALFCLRYWALLTFGAGGLVGIALLCAAAAAVLLVWLASLRGRLAVRTACKAAMLAFLAVMAANLFLLLR